MIKDLFVVFPSREAFQIVFTDDYPEFFFRVFFFEMNKRMNRIARLGQVKFDIRNLKLIIVMDRRPTIS